jgi:hypothetical protein
VAASDIQRVAARILKSPPVTGFVGPLEKVPSPDTTAKLFAF